MWTCDVELFYWIDHPFLTLTLICRDVRPGPGDRWGHLGDVSSVRPQRTRAARWSVRCLFSVSLVRFHVSCWCRLVQRWARQPHLTFHSVPQFGWRIQWHPSQPAVNQLQKVRGLLPLNAMAASILMINAYFAVLNTEDVEQRCNCVCKIGHYPCFLAFV